MSRIPITGEFISRPQNVSIDARLFNAHEENQEALKRPGTIPTHYNYATAITGGIGLNGGLILIYGDTLDVTSVFWTPWMQFYRGDLVWHDGQVWEADANSLGEVPGSGSSWSWYFIGGGCAYSAGYPYSYDDSVCEKDPVTEHLSRYRLRGYLTNIPPPSQAIVGSTIWGKGPDPYGSWSWQWIAGFPDTVAKDGLVCAALLCWHYMNTPITTGIDNWGRHYVEYATDFEVGGITALTTYDPNPPMPGGTLVTHRAVVLTPYLGAIPP